MINDSPLYWIFKKAFDDDLCERILDLARHKFKKAEIGYEEGIRINKRIRDSSVVWTTEQWLYDIVFQYMYSANANSRWEMDITAAESMQITRYKKKGFYGFHKDGSGFQVIDNPDNRFLHNTTRKLSMTALLSDDFEGGEFQFYDLDPIKMNKGDVIFFPSFELHRVNPVTKGVRHSLVTWFMGPKFK